MDEIEYENNQETNQINYSENKQVSLDNEKITSTQTQPSRKKRKNKGKTNDQPIVQSSSENQLETIIQSPPEKQENSDQSLGLSKKETKSVNINSDKDEILSNESLEETKKGLLKDSQSGKVITKTMKNIQDESNKKFKNIFSH